MARPTHQFQTTKRAEIPRSSFDLSHNLKTTFDAGLIVPILSLEVLPGDTINLRASLFGRLATPIKPILDNMYMETFFFFTPWRQVWNNFIRMMGERTDPADSIDFVIPRLSGSPIAQGDVGDYLGIPPGTDPDDVVISALPFRAHNHVYNNWFRDQNLIDSLNVLRGDGPDPMGSEGYTTLRRRRKRKDYLTAGLPWPQKGEAVNISVGGFAPVIPGPDSLTDFPVFTNGAGTQTSGLLEQATLNVALQNTVGGAATLLHWSDATGLRTDLGAATGFTINDLRESFQIQKLLERDARSGTRFPEILQSHFGVIDPLMLVHERPLFLGGGSSMINITPVQQTSGTAGDGGYTDTVQGNLAAYGTVSGSGHGFTQSFTEHGLILGYVNVRADLTYQQGLERYWSRQTRYDFFWPVLSHLGEQAVLNKEIYISNDPLIDDDVFAYMPRYDEYRYKPSQITGAFRSSATASLDVWHLAQDFASLPTLNKNFIEDNPPIDRVVAVPAEPDFLLDVYFKIRAARPLPLYGTPGLIDHF